MIPQSHEPGSGPPHVPPHLAVNAVGRRKPRTFHPLAFVLTLVGGALALGAGLLAHQVMWLRMESSADFAVEGAIVAGAVVAVGAGFLAARVGKKLCLLEHFLTFLGLLGLLVAGSFVLTGTAWGPQAVTGPMVGLEAAAAFGVLFFGFLGSSVGFLLGGGGGLDLAFSWERFIAHRHLVAKKRTTFISVITFISVAAVAVGVWALIVVLSVMSGFEDDLKTKILGTNADAVVLKYVPPFDDYQKVAGEVREVKGITGVSPFILGEGMVASESQTGGALVKGIVPSTVGQVTDLPDNVLQGSLDYLDDPERFPMPKTPGEEGPAKVLPGLAIGQEMARSLRVFLGDKITLISPLSKDLGPTGPVPRSKTFRVVAIFYTGMYEYDSKFVYLSLKQAQKFFDMGDSVTGLELRTTDIDDTRAITSRVLTRLEGYPYYTKDWGEMNKNLFSALKLEKLVMGVILAFIVLVASFVILATLIMMVMEKGKEIAILKSMGARDASIMKVFVLEGLTVGIVGTILGLALGLGTCGIISSGIISLDPEVYYISTLPVRVEPAQVVVVSIIALVLSYLATIYPSVKASRLHPVEGLRDE